MPLAQNPLSVEVELPRDDVALITVDGYLDVDTATEFQHHLANQLHHGRRHFLLDLSEVPFMDSAGLGALIGGIRRAREAEGDVAVACSRPTLTRLLHTTGFDRIVPVTETVEAAASALATAEN